MFSKFQCGFRKEFTMQDCLLLMIDKWKKTVDSNNAFGVILKDLLNTFDFICHDFLVSIVQAHGLSNNLKIIQGYLLNRKQRTKIES